MSFPLRISQQPLFLCDYTRNTSLKPRRRIKHFISDILVGDLPETNKNVI